MDAQRKAEQLLVELSSQMSAYVNFLSRVTLKVQLNGIHHNERIDSFYSFVHLADTDIHIYVYRYTHCLRC